jgi:hypothetical protein
MDDEKMNSEVLRYKKTRSNELYTEIYLALASIREFNKWATIRTNYGDCADGYDIFNDTLERTLSQYERGNFKDFLFVALRNARLNFVKKVKAHRKRCITMETQRSKEDAPTSEHYVSDDNTEEDALKKKKRTEQLTLIDSLVRPTKDDSLTHDIIKNFHRYDSIRALAKALNRNHSVVLRKLRVLSRNYDVNRFGDIRDYLA